MRRFLTAACRGIAPFLAAAMLLFAITAVKSFLEIRPAADYQDEGTHTFTASSGYPTTRRGHWQKQYHRYSTKYVYVVEYRAPGGWRWRRDFPYESAGKVAIQNRERVERQVFSLTGENAYITTDPGLTPQSYVERQQRRYLMVTAVCLAVAASEGAIYLLVRSRRNPPGEG